MASIFGILNRIIEFFEEIAETIGDYFEALLELIF